MQIFDLMRLPSEWREAAGGKARGLNDLMRAGLRVAEGYVIIGMETDADIKKAGEFFADCGLPCVAVRSSASNEDGADFSSAGQYTTVLNVRGREEFEAAAKKCLESLTGAGAQSYSAFFPKAKSPKMSVVVQQMINPLAAGVCFTADPVKGGDCMLIEAVEGLGESLVSGAAAAQGYSVAVARSKSGMLYPTEDLNAGGILDEGALAEIVSGAAKAESFFGCPLDTEWAIDALGTLFWLQARPITAANEPGIDELDSADIADTDIISNCNIGEMLPGAVTPLSLSTSVEGIDWGLREMMFKAGAYKRKTNELPSGSCIVHFSNHLFFNLTKIFKMAFCILGAKQEYVEASICGKELNTPAADFKRKNILTRIFNSFSYFGYIFSYKKAMKRMVKINENLKFTGSADLEALYRDIDSKLLQIFIATGCHYVTSSQSGAMSSTLMGIMKSGGMTDEEARAALAKLLINIDGIESVDILRSMRVLGREVLKVRPDAAEMSETELAAFIKEEGGAVTAAYNSFMARHGHRGIREADMRSESWASDEAAFINNLLTVIRTGAAESVREGSFERNLQEFLKGKKQKGTLKFLINQSRMGVRNREFTKSHFVKTVDLFKGAYRRLAALLVAEGALPDPDLIYFLTHAEIGELILERKAALIKTAIRRRRLLDVQRTLKFNDVNIGVPKAVKPKPSEKCSVLSGAPISRGEVTGAARIVNGIEDAVKLKEGEIMVASFTDIGWSPYYCLIGGLITEIGSALSHGAVVAREYSLPLVSNIADATRIIKTGDIISLNANTGTVTILESAQ